MSDWWASDLPLSSIGLPQPLVFAVCPQGNRSLCAQGRNRSPGLGQVFFVMFCLVVGMQFRFLLMVGRNQIGHCTQEFGQVDGSSLGCVQLVCCVWRGLENALGNSQGNQISWIRDGSGTLP